MINHRRLLELGAAWTKVGVVIREGMHEIKTMKGVYFLNMTRSEI